MKDKIKSLIKSEIECNFNLAKQLCEGQNIEFNDIIEEMYGFGEYWIVNKKVVDQILWDYYYYWPYEPYISEQNIITLRCCEKYGLQVVILLNKKDRVVKLDVHISCFLDATGGGKTVKKFIKNGDIFKPKNNIQKIQD